MVKNHFSIMTRIESTTHVEGKPEQVFAFLNSAESHARFIPNMAEFRQTSAGTFGQVGTRAKGVLSYLGVIKIPVLYVIIEHEGNRRLAMEGEMGPILFKDGYVLRKDGQGTEINFWLELTLTGWTRLLAPFMSLIGRIHAWETLRNLSRELAKSEIFTSRLRSSQ